MTQTPQGVHSYCHGRITAPVVDNAGIRRKKLHFGSFRNRSHLWLNTGLYAVIMSLIGEYPCRNATVPTNLSFTTASISGFISVVATIGNSLVLLAVFLDPNKNLRSPFNYFVANLAFADLLVGVAIAPLSVIYHISEGLKSLLKAKIEHYLFFSYFIVCTASLLSLIILALDRYVSITYPLHYVALLDAKKSFIISTSAWIISAALSLIYFWVGVNIYRFVFANTAIAVTFTILIFTHAKILRSFQAQVRQWDELHDSTEENVAKKKALEWEKKITKALLIVLGIFLACFLPSCVCIYIINLCSTCNCVFINWIRDIQFILVMANSGLNPIVYPCRMQTFRQAISTILSCGTCKGRPHRRNVSESRVPTVTTDVSIK